jgi:hypothetical protein
MKGINQGTRWVLLMKKPKGQLMQGYRLGHTEGTPTNPKVHAPLRFWRHLLQNLEAVSCSDLKAVFHHDLEAMIQ